VTLFFFDFYNINNIQSKLLDNCGNQADMQQGKQAKAGIQKSTGYRSLRRVRLCVIYITSEMNAMEFDE
jgi:hypothetical protein